MLLSWVVFPLVLVFVCAGWGLLARRALVPDLDGALTIPLGFAAVIVVASLITAWPAIAPATVTVVAVGAVAGLASELRRFGPDPWVLVLGIAVLVAFGAPVILSGEPTFTGYIRLDDTATWLSIADRILGHGRSLSALPLSTYALNLHAYITTMGYPLGAFLPLAIGRALVGVDAAWVFQPFLAWCGVVIALVIYSTARRAIPSNPVRAAVAFFAAQPALLYGYALWGGIKELVAAALLATLAAVAARALTRDRRWIVTLAVVTAALADTLGPGAVAWAAPALAAVVVSWLWPVRRALAERIRGLLVDTGLLGGTTAVLMLPIWLELSAFLSGNSELFSNASSNSSSGESGLVSLYHPLSALQLGGVWPVGDFRLTASAGATAPLLVAVALGLIAALALGVWKRVPAIALYAGAAVLGALIVWLGGSNPWVVGKSLAISSPAIPALALVGAAALASRHRLPGVALLAVIGAGIVWSNVLGYHDATLAPYQRLAELQHIAPLVKGHGPTFINEYEIYADRHFLRDAAPTEPAEYRPFQLPLSDGALLTQTAQADLDAFPAQLLIEFPSIVTRISPVASRPPSVYHLVWRGHYYELWQRPAKPPTSVLEHVPFGDSSIYPYCGRSEGSYAPLCAIQPVGTAPCRLVLSLARHATAEHASLVAYQRPAPIVARAGQTRWPGAWTFDSSAQTLVPTAPGVLAAHIAVASAQHYAIWLGGSFARGFDVSVDGHDLGRVKDQLQNIGQYARAGEVALGAGVHTILLRYPHSDLTPGSGADLTELSAIALQPLDSPATRMLTVAPAQARTLCGRSLDWIEIVRGQS